MIFRRRGRSKRGAGGAPASAPGDRQGEATAGAAPGEPDEADIVPRGGTGGTPGTPGGHDRGAPSPAPEGEARVIDLRDQADGAEAGPEPGESHGEAGQRAEPVDTAAGGPAPTHHEVPVGVAHWSESGAPGLDPGMGLEPGPTIAAVTGTGVEVDATGERARPPVTFTPTVDRGAARLVETLAADLAGSRAGIDFIYRSLERIAATTQADDTMLVVDNDELGRQAFRAGRRPVESSWGRDVVRVAASGVHLQGADLDEEVAATVTNLSSVALRLDIATHDSLHDSLTGLLNRRSFDDQLDAACAQSERYGWRFSLVLIDLDSFKSVNDRLGHQAGDTILRAVGAELRSGLRVGDAAARVGGDEFALILPNADEALLPSLLERLKGAVSDALPSARVGLSAGMAIAPEDGTDMASLFRMADQRLYEAKSR